MNFVSDLARQAEEAVGKGDLKDLYSITRTLAGVRKITDRPVQTKSREVHTDQEEQRRRWAEHIRTLCSIDPHQARCLR